MAIFLVLVELIIKKGKGRKKGGKEGKRGRKKRKGEQRNRKKGRGD
jgi:hypothetical protein